APGVVRAGGWDFLPVPVGTAHNRITVGVARAYAQVAEHGAVEEFPAQIGAPGDLVGIIVIALVEVRHPAGIVVDVRHVAGDRLGGGLADDVDRGPTAAEIDDHRRHAIHAVPAAPVIAVRQLPGEK